MIPAVARFRTRSSAFRSAARATNSVRSNGQGTGPPPAPAPAPVQRRRIGRSGRDARPLDLDEANAEDELVGLLRGDTVHASPPAGRAADWVRPHRPGRAFIRACGRLTRRGRQKGISPYFWHNGRYPDSPQYKALQASGFAGYRLQTDGLVAQRWPGVTKWGGVSMSAAILDLVTPDPQARWVVFYSLVVGADSGAYYDAHRIEQMCSKFTSSPTT